MQVQKVWTKDQIGIVKAQGKDSNDFITYELLGQRFVLWSMEGKKQKIIDTINEIKALGVVLTLDKYRNIVLRLNISSDNEVNERIIKSLEKLDIVNKLSPDVKRRDGRFNYNIKLYKELEQ